MKLSNMGRSATKANIMVVASHAAHHENLAKLDPGRSV
jgi:hypothetical protein